MEQQKQNEGVALRSAGPMLQVLAEDGSGLSANVPNARPRGFYGIGIWHGKTEHNIGTLWRNAYIFGASFVFTVGTRYRRQASDTLKAVRHVPLYHYADIDDLIAHLPNSCPLIGVELTDDAQDVATFKHPQRACYLLGAEDHGLSPNVLAQCHSLIKLPGKYSMNVAVAGTLIMYERQRVEGPSKTGREATEPLQHATRRVTP